MKKRTNNEGGGGEREKNGDKTENERGGGGGGCVGRCEGCQTWRYPRQQLPSLPMLQTLTLSLSLSLPLPLLPSTTPFHFTISPLHSHDTLRNFFFYNK